jgi:acetyl esterase/lipase
VGGTSSGGNIANAVIYLNRDQEHPVRVTGQFLSVAPLLPAPVVPAEYRLEYVSHEENKDISLPSSDLEQLFLCKSSLSQLHPLHQTSYQMASLYLYD